MEEYLYILILSAAIVFACISYFINNRLVSQRSSQRVLNWFLLFLIIHCTVTILVRFFFEEETFVYLGMPFGVFYAPYFYCCFKTFVGEVKGNDDTTKSVSVFIKDDYIHFVPGVLFFIGYIITLFNLGSVDVEFFIYYYLVNYVVLGSQLILYAIFGYLAVSKLNMSSHVRLLVLRVIWIMVFVGIVSIGLVLYNAIPNNDGNVLYLGVLCLAMTIFFYYVERLKNDEVFISHGEGERTTEVVDVELNKYEKSKFANEFVGEYKEKIEKVILKEQLFLKTNCSLDLVEKLTRIQKHHLSQFFSTEYGKNFNTYINELRVEYAKETLKARDYNVSVSELGEECGFNSRTSFFRAFKKYVGVSPSEYIENQQVRTTNNNN
ncbi:helix-turn-helix transcriptional regulator [Myroides odoratimimus]|uniref:helix-turn-helix transcriptional regulator n=1 Tax=Myroides odoratimimus TaxID=76832 RepID=UPI001CE1740F|nr:helix-turn-helix transcriptional regulator [Myroides odoratimimus]MCA4793351.1 helix-turn-helix transcriptional regulator [Myroides odoratimimus]MCA4820612.1 helix-turn-helix transcriptional regulator [Myroides odoratimimus]MDM1454721.1 helix-turn-helix transcriptional regulator [Myroides odoratimimus]MDM1478443.1 helix-turn-helix transcriptional regulator [Myroides odoratimimus]MDM1490721.1 helix-turn-helix transcriptional regulator [Myroides odoratimimus]